MRLTGVIFSALALALATTNIVNAAVAPKKAPVKITLDDILNSTYQVSGWSGSWVSDDTVQRSVGGNIILYNVTSNDSKTKLNGTEFSQYPGRSFSFSGDGRFVLITHSVKYLWRHSFTAKFDIHDIAENKTMKLVPSDSEEQQELQLVKWAPTGNSLIFIYGGDIYYRADAADNTTQVRLTADGSEIVTNGHADWVYEEEMFGDNTAAWFSPDSAKLAFVRFDDTLVDDFTYPMYGEPGNNMTTYPTWIDIKYPKSGKTNPIVSLHVVSLSATPSIRNVTYPGQAPALLHYIATVDWLSNANLMVVHLNRAQQNSTWSVCNTAALGTILCNQVYSFSEPTGWIDISHPVISLDGTHFLTTKINDNSTGALDYKHIVLVNVTAASGTRINKETYSVDSILRWDEANGHIYFTASGLASNGDPEPSHTHVYQIEYNVPDAKAKCLTCTWNNSHNQLCLQNSVSFSTAFTYALHTCSGPNVPQTVMRMSPNWDVTRELALNDQLRETLDTTVDFPTFRDFKVDISGYPLPIRARLYLPKDFDESRKYPLFIDVYGGPGSQNIRQGFGITWGTSLVSNRDIIYGFIDGRGSARQTGDHLFQLRNSLGTLEITDQIAAAKKLIADHSFIDANRTAIWGWSYGGYATAMVMAKDTEQVFKCGISVAPVTNWLYYDTIYTERFMDEPMNNQAGYDAGDVTSEANAKAIGNHQFFLVHGNADDNVHYQQSMILGRALEKADVMFNQLSYPDEAHGINGPGMRRHLYHSLEKFLFRDCFPAIAPEDPATSAAPIPSTLSIACWVFSVLLLNLAIL